MRTALWLILVTALGGPTGGALAEGSADPGWYPFEKMNNWGRWGRDDQLGAVHYTTPESIVAAARLIQRGAVFSLAIPLDEKGPVFPGRTNPQHMMVVSGADYAAGSKAGLQFGKMKFADDYIFMPLQGSTQWDGLAHGWYGDQLYNGTPESEIRSAPLAGGATRLGIQNLKDRMVGRGVLVDIVRYKGGSLPAGYAITAADIQGALEAQGSKVQEGDIVIVRTGVVPDFYALQDPVEKLKFLTAPQAGVASDVVPWAKDKKISAMAADNIALEVTPNPVAVQSPFPIHGHFLRDLGIYIGEIWWLEDLAEDCARDGRYEFFLAAQPLNLTGAVGSPLNPVAIK